MAGHSIRFCPGGPCRGGSARWGASRGWLYLADGGLVPPMDLPLDVVRLPDTPVQRVFDGATLPMEFQWLRTPVPERLFTLTVSALRLTGRESLGSWFEQEHLVYAAETVVSCDLSHWQRAAGLTTYDNRNMFPAGLVTREHGSRVLQRVSCLGDWQVDRAVQQFYWAAGNDWQAVGPVLDASLISDEGGRGEHGPFTGAFVGVVADDLTGQGWAADFISFDYVPGELA